MNFQLFAHPWWVNLCWAIPFASYYSWRKEGLYISKLLLIILAIFSIAFGFVEAVVVFYLRSASGMVSPALYNSQILAFYELPHKLFLVEFLREATTMIMLVCAALLSVKARRERWAVFFWTFAFWDIFYYAGLYLITGWPSSLLTADILFLIPVPWISQVWFPLIVSFLTIVAVLVNRNLQVEH